MYFVERLIGVITYVLLLIVFCLYIKNKQVKGKKLNRTLKIYKWLLCIMAFFYIPALTADLSRLTVEMHLFSAMSFSSILSKATSSTDPMRILYMYFIGKIGIDGLLPATSCFIFFSCVFKIIVDSSERFAADSKSTAFSLFLFMMLGKFLEVISGIRCLMALSIVCYCIYQELIAEKKFLFHVPLYIFAVLMHQTAFALVIIRVVFLLFQKSKNGFKKVINYTIMFVLLILLLRTSIFSNGVMVTFQAYVSKAGYFYIWEYLVNLFSFFIYLITMIKFKKVICDNVHLKNLFRFISFLSVIIAIFFFEYSIFTRYMAVLATLMIPIFNYVISKMNQEKGAYRNYCFVLYIYMFFTFLMVCTRGNLCGFKFFILK